MGADTKIEWADHTFNPWTGCTRVSEACDHCYAEAFSRRAPKHLGKWGPGEERKRTREANWALPRKWNREAELAIRPASDICEECGREVPGQERGTAKWCVCGNTDFPRPKRPRVFGGSMMDWLDEEVPAEMLADYLRLIHETPHLDWLLLTKRPEAWEGRMLCALEHMDDDEPVFTWVAQWLNGLPLRSVPSGPIPPGNVWIGATVENQAWADVRIPRLLKIPAAVHFLSVEPLLGEVDIRFGLHRNPEAKVCPRCLYATNRATELRCPNDDCVLRDDVAVDWVIAGGESGPGARPSHPDWFRGVRDQCVAAGVPFFFKQWGEWCPVTGLYEEHDQDAMDGSDGDRTKVVYSDGKKWPWEWGQPVTEGRPWVVERMGKKAAGRLLDGREWSEFPRGAAEV